MSFLCLLKLTKRIRPRYKLAFNFFLSILNIIIKSLLKGMF